MDLTFTIRMRHTAFFNVILTILFIGSFHIISGAQNQHVHQKAWKFYKASEMDSAYHYFSILDSIGYATNDSMFITDATIFLSGYDFYSTGGKNTIAIVDKGYPYITEMENRIDVLCSVTNLIESKTPFGDSIYNMLMPMVEHASEEIIYKTTAYNNYALYNLKQGNLAKSAINYQKAIEHSKNDFTKFSTLVSGINVFEMMGNIEMMKNYIDQAIEIGERNKYKAVNGPLAMYRSNYLVLQGDLDGAKRELTKAMNHEPQFDKRAHYEELLTTAKKYYAAIDDWISFEKLLEKIDSKLRDFGSTNTSFYHLALANIAYHKAEYSEAEEYSKKSIDIAKKINHRIKLRDATKLLSQIYEKKQNHKLALKYQQGAEQLTEDIFRDNQAQNVIYLNAVFEKKQQDLQIKVLNQENVLNKAKIDIQNRRIIYGGIALALFAFFSMLLLRLYKKVSSQKEVIASALSDKDILLREIHHRVKNNLQLVSSLLTLQGRSISDNTAQIAIQEGKNRVRSMALIHQDLYNRENLKGISVKEYLEKLTLELFTTYKITSEKIDLKLDIDDIELDVDTMVPLGLIINELLTNSLKYAFEGKENGILRVNLKKNGDKVNLEISDNGKGYDPAEIRENSFGTTLINALTEQIEGEMTSNLTNGTSVNIQFDLPSIS